MKINVVNLKADVYKLNKLIDEYENTFLNFYNEISTGFVYWDDNISKSFFDEVNIEKVQVRNTINELKDIKDIYEEIIKKYEIFGKKIDVILKSKSIVLSKINTYLDKLYEIIEKYHELNLDFCPVEGNMIYSHMDKLITIGNNMVSLKEEINKKYEMVEEIERTVNLKLSKIKIEYLNEMEINKFI